MPEAISELTSSIQNRREGYFPASERVTLLSEHLQLSLTQTVEKLERLSTVEMSILRMPSH